MFHLAGVCRLVSTALLTCSPLWIERSGSCLVLLCIELGIGIFLLQALLLLLVMDLLDGPSSLEAASQKVGTDALAC